MGRFLGKPDLESFPNAAKKGMKIFTNQQVHAVSGYERLYRLFWNRKAEELCRSPSYAKWSKSAITGVIATEWSLKKTALLFNHATRLMDQEPGPGAKRKQKADTVHQGALSMLNEHKNLLHLDEELRKLKRPDNTKRDKKKKIQAMEDAMQAKITELKKRQEALRKGLENMAKEKGANNTEIVKQMDVNTTQLDSSSVQALINTIMPQQDAGEGCSGVKGPDKEDSEAEESESGRSPENCLGENSPDEDEGERESDSGRSDDCGGAYCSDGEKSERDSDSYDEGEQSPSRKRQKMD